MTNPLSAGYIGFEIFVGTRRVSCGVSNDALDAISCLALPSTPTARNRSFNRFRVLIHKAAERKVLECHDNSNDYILIQSEDLRRIPPESGNPAFTTGIR
ncbi:DUF1488 family protein [Acetobacter sp.]|uniref:DUF1488 family protein n=1 Tax=Acetobacter sp. TaxID=440 RepID=UPI00345BAB0F